MNEQATETELSEVLLTREFDVFESDEVLLTIRTIGEAARFLAGPLAPCEGSDLYWRCMRALETANTRRTEYLIRVATGYFDRLTRSEGVWADMRPPR